MALSLLLTLAACGAPPQLVTDHAPAPSITPSPIRNPTSAPADVSLPPAPTSTALPPPTSIPPPAASLPGIEAAGGESPGGLWRWRLEPGPRGSEPFLILHLKQRDGQREWFTQVEPTGFLPPEEGGTVYERPFFWLPKDPYVYLVGETCCGEAPRLPFASGFWLRRLDLSTGAVTHILGEKDGRGLYHFSFSPIGQFLLYTRPDLSNRVTLIHLADGAVAEASLPAGYTTGGVVSWAPDETQAALLTCSDDPSAGGTPPCRWSFWLLSTANMALTPYNLDSVFSQPGDDLESVVWISRSRLSLHMLSGRAWHLDLVSGKVTCQPETGASCP